MGLGSRLKEERLRLGMNQTDFAALAGVSKGAQINWEKDVHSPPASVLADYGEAGVDIFYVVTGRRLPAERDMISSQIDSDLEEIELNLLDPKRQAAPGESEDETERRILEKAVGTLRDILRKYEPVTDEQLERASALLDAALSAPKLALMRAADFAQKRKRLDDEKELISIWLNGSDYQPDHAPMKIMATLALEYGVPYRTLVELSQEIARDVIEQEHAERVIAREEGEAASKSCV